MKHSHYKIETSVAFPEEPERCNRKGASKFPIRYMEVGDSFFASGYTPRTIASGLYAAATKLAKEKKESPRRFLRRLEEVNDIKGTRVWRIS